MGNHPTKPFSLWKLGVKPVIIGGGMGLGALLGVTAFSDNLSRHGPAGDIAGAAGALVVGLNLISGFGFSALMTLIGFFSGRPKAGKPLSGLSNPTTG